MTAPAVDIRSWDQALAGRAEVNLSALGYPWDDSWALHPEVCQMLGRWIRAQKPRIVVEFGSGFSTYLIAAELRGIPGARLFSFEHHPLIHEKVQRGLTERGLDGQVRLSLCPLSIGLHSGRPLISYQIPRRVWQAIPPVELAVVDGPPADAFGREAAGYRLVPKMAPDGWILLDDAERPHERACVDRWRAHARGGLDARILDIGRGVALMRFRDRGTRRWSFVGSGTSLRETVSRLANLLHTDRHEALRLFLRRMGWPR
jgi:hypothetical protein